MARKQGNQINLSLYKANLSSDGFTRVTGSAVSVLDDYFGSATLDAANFRGLSGIRTSKAIGKTSCLRNLDGLVAIYASGNEMRIVGKRKISATEIDYTIRLDGEFVAAAFGNSDLDVGNTDELFVVTKSGSGSVVNVYNFRGNNEFEKSGVELALSAGSLKNFCVFGKYYYLNDTSL